MNQKLVLLFSLWISTQIYAQSDTLKYQWPVTPFNSSQWINATFCEFRNTLSSDHFHNAVDIGKADGEPCYPVFDGEVFVIDNSGSNSYVRIATFINNKWKHITYLHISPNPALAVGNQVQKGITILGTIYTGMGHVHLIERELVNHIGDYGAEINNLRQNGGLIPYSDPDSPVIDRSSLKFYIDGTDIEVPSYGLSGRIDIRIKIVEYNGPGSVQRNNGTYLAGYRVWNPDTSQIVYEPDDAGVKYRFDRKPFNNYVHKVFVENVATLSNPVYWLTNGNGANDINQTQAVTNNYFQASLLDTGNYVLEIFTEDTRGNQDIEYFAFGITDQDLTPPVTPELYSLVNLNLRKSVQIRWSSNSENDLLGYRLYYSSDNQLSNWEIAADEFQLTRDSTSFYIESPDSFIVKPTEDIYFFRLTAIDSSGNESDPGDVYARSAHIDGSGKDKALIVNGFTRFGGSGSWQNPTHSFVKSYFDPLMVSDSLVISSCSNEAVEQNRIILDDYDIVIWFVGDESTVDNTFTAAEQSKIKAYLENGGKLFVTGSEIGWDLGRSHSRSEPGDQDFYHNYIKANYIYDGNSSMSPATGTSGSIFQNTQLNFGQTYPEDYPDDIDPNGGAQLIIEYNQIRTGSTYRRAGIAYSGTFGQSQETGQLVYLAFPFETVNSLSQRQNFISALLSFFNIVSSVDEPLTSLPREFSISQNYPNPFNPSTHFDISIPSKQKVTIQIFDMLGREVQTIITDVFSPGKYTFTWNARRFASGVYLLKMQAGQFYQSRKILLLK